MGARAPYDPTDYVSRGPLTDPKCADEVSEFFLDAMRSRMAVSFYKYGPVANAYPEKVDAIESAMLRIKEYLTPERWDALVAAMPRLTAQPRKAKQPGNAEYLADASNFLHIEFKHPSQPEAFFAGTDADQSPGRIEKTSGEAVAWMNKEMFPA